jgi:GWxTD domain-containing protein
MRRLALMALLAGGVACGNWSRVGGNTEPKAGESLTQFFNPQRFYQALGRLAAGDPIPFVGTVAFTAALSDTVLATLGLSMENRALSFQKEGKGFVAHYRVDVSFQREGQPAITGGQEEVVRVASFQETQRADESVLFQKAFRVQSGRYHVVVTLRDPNSTGSSKAENDFTAPSYGPGTTSDPILAYQATGRAQLSDPLRIVLNPRGTVSYGGDTLLAYVEGYGFGSSTRVPFEVRTDQDSVVFNDSLTFQGGHAVESQVIRLRPDSIALGELRLVVGKGDAARSTSAVVSFSSAWVVTNFDEMVNVLRYFGHEAELSEIKKAPPSQRLALWRKFWVASDPNPATPENEALNAYFSRVALANSRFREEGLPGWRTDRGEALIRLGEPDETYEPGPGTSNRVLRWTYTVQRVELYFIDETGFGRFRLTSNSRSELELAAQRLERSGT